MTGHKLWFVVSLLGVFTNCHALDDPNLKGYAEIKGVDAGYIPRGRVVNIGNLPVYEAPDNVNRRRLLIGVYDISGFSAPNMLQITDLMAQQDGGLRAVLPDFFRGESWNFSTPVM